MEDSLNENQELAAETTENLAAVEATDGVAGLAGRELDAAVAERLMGLKVGHLKRDHKQENSFDDYTPYRNNHTGELMSGTMYSEGMAVIGRYSVPRYSSSIAAAMEVVEKMRDAKWDIQITSDDESPAWQVSFDSRGATGKLLLGEAESDSLPEAISRAALATVNVPE